MIYEYALEPALAATWGTPPNFRYFAENFGLGQGRIISRYPKNWKRLVWNAWESLRICDDLERARVVELIVRLTERMIVRTGYLWDPPHNWLENAENEHNRFPFRAILAVHNPRNTAHVLNCSSIDGLKSNLWEVVRGLSIPRKPRDMAHAVSSMLQCCRVAIFIDPNFGPENQRHRRPLEAFLQSLVRNRIVPPPIRIEVQTSAKSTADFFRTTCEQKLPRVIPTGISVVFKRWKQRPGGEKLHNRFILTDLGGVIFNTGLDDGQEGETDDLNRMDREQYALRWSQYASDIPAFDLAENPIIITGE